MYHSAKSLQRALSLLCLAGFVLGAIACGQTQTAETKDALIGHWIVDPDGKEHDIFPVELELRDDGSAKVFEIRRDGTRNLEDHGTWKRKDGRDVALIELESALKEKQPATFTARISEGRLIFEMKQGGRAQSMPLVPFVDAKRQGHVERMNGASKSEDAAIERDVAVSMDNMKNLITLMLASTGADAKKWPRYAGKNFILWLVAKGVIDRNNKGQLANLFSPADPSRSADKVPEAKWKQVTVRALKGGEDFGDLTSYAGRINDRPRFRITPARIKDRAIILVDPHFAPHGFVLVGRLDGSVEKMAVEVEPGIPFLGEDADNEDLGAISDR